MDDKNIVDFTNHFINFYLSVAGVESITLSYATWYEARHVFSRYANLGLGGPYVDIRGEEMRICGVEIKKGS